jgi:predicted nucleotidyltransferase
MSLKRLHQLDEPQRQRLRDDVAAFIRRECPEVLAAYVFGSFQTPGPFADIDLGVLLGACPHAALDLELQLEGRLADLVHYPFDIRVLNGAPSAFVQEAIRGRVILDRDPDARADFETAVLKRYFDFAPFRSRYLAEVLNAPV